MATKELTFGNPLKLIILFMLPVFFGNIIMQLYNFFDAMIVGRYIGLNALAAVGATVPFIFFIISFVFAATQGFTIITAQKFGAKEYSMVRKSLVASTLISIILTVVLTAISTPFSYKFLFWLNTPDDIINLSANYLCIMFFGIFATVFYNLFSNVIRSLGDSKTPLYFLIFSAILNIIMDLIFVIYFHWGIKGAAWATVFSQAVSTILCTFYMFHKFPILKLQNDDFCVSKEFLMEHLKIGIPMGFQMSVLSLGLIALQYVLNSFGAIAVAAFSTSMRIDQLFSQAYLAIGATIAVYTAQNYGAGDYKRIKTGAKISMAIVAIITIVSIIMIKLFSTQLLLLFMNEVNIEMIRLANQYLNIIVTFFIFLGTLLVYRNILQGMGYVMVPFISCIAELIFRTAGAFIFGYYFDYIGVCYASPAAWIAASIVLYTGYKIMYKNIKRINI